MDWIAFYQMSVCSGTQILQRWNLSYMFYVGREETWLMLNMEELDPKTEVLENQEVSLVLCVSVHAV
jgi:hypothetical protein